MVTSAIIGWTWSHNNSCKGRRCQYTAVLHTGTKMWCWYLCSARLSICEQKLISIIHADTHRHIHILIHMHRHTHTHIYTNACTHMRTNRHTYTHTHTHTHTHIHAYTHIDMYTEVNHLPPQCLIWNLY